MIMNSSLRLLLSLIFLAPVAASALEAVLTDDSYTIAASPSTTHTTDAALLVRGGAAGGICRAWFKFRLGAVLPPNKTSDQITVATLKVYIPTYAQTEWRGRTPDSTIGDGCSERFPCQMGGSKCIHPEYGSENPFSTRDYKHTCDCRARVNLCIAS